MKFVYQPKNQLENFGAKIYNLLVENFPQAFYVGGMVRDLLLHRPITDIDLATSALPEDVTRLLEKNMVASDKRGKDFGIITAVSGNKKIEIATFRTETYQSSRYPKVTFVKSPQKDSNRRDFTINSLYLSAKEEIILDFHDGIKDIQDKKIRFVGNPSDRIYEDPLRIIRALRFAGDLKFNLDLKTYNAIRNNFLELKKLSQSRVQTELERCKLASTKKKIILSLIEPKSLDKYFLES